MLSDSGRTRRRNPIVWSMKPEQTRERAVDDDKRSGTAPRAPTRFDMGNGWTRDGPVPIGEPAGQHRRA
jgi:hypothetical protein